MSNETLYILMRTDMDSMNPGKACAQAAHAANAFVSNVSRSDSHMSAFINWENHTVQSFGTTIVLNASEKSINAFFDEFGMSNTCMEKILDPTYPIRDGEVTHYIPVVTCAYVFVHDRTDENDPVVAYIKKNFELHP